MKEEFSDLTVTIELPYREADNLAEFVAAYGNAEDSSIVDMIRFAMCQAVEQRRKQDRRATVGKHSS